MVSVVWCCRVFVLLRLLFWFECWSWLLRLFMSVISWLNRCGLLLWSWRWWRFVSVSRLFVICMMIWFRCWLWCRFVWCGCNIMLILMWCVWLWSWMIWWDGLIVLCVFWLSSCCCWFFMSWVWCWCWIGWFSSLSRIMGLRLRCRMMVGLSCCLLRLFLLFFVVCGSCLLMWLSMCRCSLCWCFWLLKVGVIL